MAAIYILVDPRDSSVRYVGQTVKPLAQRLSGHLCLARKGSKTYSARWIRLLLAAGLRPQIALLEETDQPAEREKFWIAHFFKIGARLTNLTNGGDGCFIYPSRPLSPEHKAKLSAAHLGKPKSEEAKARMRKPKSAEARRNMAAAQKGKKRGPLSVEARAKLSAALTGRKLAPEHVAKVSAAQKGRQHTPMTDEIRRKISAAEKGKAKNMAGARSPEARAKVVAKLRANPPRAKLTPAQVREIRSLHRNEGWSGINLAIRFDVGTSTVSAILNNVTWTHLL